MHGLSAERFEGSDRGIRESHSSRSAVKLVSGGHKMNVGNFLALVLKGMFNPVTIATVAAPMLMNINLLAIRENLTRGEGVWNERLLAILSDPPALAILDYRTQLYTLLIVVIFYAGQNLAFYWKNFFSHKTGDVALAELTSDRAAMLHLTLVILACLSVVAFTLIEQYSGSSLVHKYVRETVDISIVATPPLGSEITWLRVIFIFMGIYTTTFIRSYKPK